MPGFADSRQCSISHWRAFSLLGGSCQHPGSDTSASALPSPASAADQVDHLVTSVELVRLSRCEAPVKRDEERSKSKLARSTKSWPHLSATWRLPGTARGGHRSNSMLPIRRIGW